MAEDHEKLNMMVHCSPLPDDGCTMVRSLRLPLLCLPHHGGFLRVINQNKAFPSQDAFCQVIHVALLLLRSIVLFYIFFFLLVRLGTQGGNLESGSEANTTEECYLLAHALTHLPRDGTPHQ